ncbi:MAG: NAD+ synthase [bacterium]
MKIAIAQINTTVGDFAGNSAKIITGIRQGERAGVDVVLFPELAISGYPPRDMLEKPSFIEGNLRAIEAVAKETRGTAALVGFASRNESKDGRGLFNSAGFLHDGSVKFVQHKTLLPQYDVFDEGRHFEPAKEHEVYEFKGRRIGITLCEDLWSKHSFRGRRLYRVDPAHLLKEAGAELIFNISASPFTVGKQRIRYDLFSAEAKSVGLPVFYCNMVGGNDELVFDGRSFVLDAEGRTVCEAQAFEEDFIVVDSDAMGKPSDIVDLPEEEEIWRALVLGLSDYMKKCGFARAVVGLSGGIDSAVVAAIACDAVGPDKVLGVMLPSPYTEERSLRDAERLARNLGISTWHVPINEIYETYRRALGYSSKDAGEVSLAEENIQSRIRGNILMAISNREGSIVLSTGNKSELSVGYCTLYGDMAGGFALISDIPKKIVYRLAQYANRGGERIPKAIILRPPSAELKPNQADTDSLPPYDVLDPIMRHYIEDRMSAEEIVARGFDKDTALRIIRMIDANEYKRRQAPPGIKITMKAFGMGRRFPIARKS